MKCRHITHNFITLQLSQKQELEQNQFIYAQHSTVYEQFSQRRAAQKSNYTIKLLMSCAVAHHPFRNHIPKVYFYHPSDSISVSTSKNTIIRFLLVQKESFALNEQIEAKLNLRW